AEDGIRDGHVTGVQTCALPISLTRGRTLSAASTTDRTALDGSLAGMAHEIERPPTDARLSLTKDGAIESSAAHDGLSINIPASRSEERRVGKECRLRGSPDPLR